jgi:hypothetical protein
MTRKKRNKKLHPSWRNDTPAPSVIASSLKNVSSISLLKIHKGGMKIVTEVIEEKKNLLELEDLQDIYYGLYVMCDCIAQMQTNMAQQKPKKPRKKNASSQSKDHSTNRRPQQRKKTRSKKHQSNKKKP